MFHAIKIFVWKSFICQFIVWKSISDLFKTNLKYFKLGFTPWTEPHPSHYWDIQRSKLQNRSQQFDINCLSKYIQMAPSFNVKKIEKEKLFVRIKNLRFDTDFFQTFLNLSLIESPKFLSTILVLTPFSQNWEMIWIRQPAWQNQNFPE